PEIKPEFIDFKTAIQTSKLKDKTVSFVKNKYNVESLQIQFMFSLSVTDNDKVTLLLQELFLNT
ncbi:hypothetical protein, partial [Chryseobacterium sp. CH1]|uniref:hypothetical protein n=1 Tax=Chryseobacterium sp. CH1 TaxID=713551 RepID=UPI0010259F5A